MKRVTLFITIFLSTSCFAQVSINDSLVLLKLCSEFKTAVHRLDSAALTHISLGKIHCVSCVETPTQPPVSYYIPTSAFIHWAFDSVNTSRLLHCIDTENPRIHPLIVRGGELEDIKLKGVTIFEVFYTTIKDNGNTQAGQETGLQFIRTATGFRLFGLTTVP